MELLTFEVVATQIAYTFDFTAIDFSELVFINLLILQK